MTPDCADKGRSGAEFGCVIRCLAVHAERRSAACGISATARSPQADKNSRSTENQISIVAQMFCVLSRRLTRHVEILESCRRFLGLIRKSHEMLVIRLFYHVDASPFSRRRQLQKYLLVQVFWSGRILPTARSSVAPAVWGR